jgi:hypothetical protein
MAAFTRVSPTTCESLDAFALCTTNIAVDDDFRRDVSDRASFVLLALCKVPAAIICGVPCISPMLVLTPLTVCTLTVQM